MSPMLCLSNITLQDCSRRCHISVYTTRILEHFDAKISLGGWKSSSVMISKNISHSGLRPSCDIFLDIITSDDFQPPWDNIASKCSRILVVYTFISTSTSSRLIWKIYPTRACGPRVIYSISHSSTNLTVWYNIISGICLDTRYWYLVSVWTLDIDILYLSGH